MWKKFEGGAPSWFKMQINFLSKNLYLKISLSKQKKRKWSIFSHDTSVVLLGKAKSNCYFWWWPLQEPVIVKYSNIIYFQIVHNDLHKIHDQKDKGKKSPRGPHFLESISSSQNNFDIKRTIWKKLCGKKFEGGAPSWFKMQINFLSKNLYLKISLSKQKKRKWSIFSHDTSVVLLGKAKSNCYFWWWPLQEPVIVKYSNIIYFQIVHNDLHKIHDQKDKGKKSPRGPHFLESISSSQNNFDIKRTIWKKLCGKKFEGGAPSWFKMQINFLSKNLYLKISLSKQKKRKWSIFSHDTSVVLLGKAKSNCYFWWWPLQEPVIVKYSNIIYFQIVHNDLHKIHDQKDKWKKSPHSIWSFASARIFLRVFLVPKTILTWNGP